MLLARRALVVVALAAVTAGCGDDAASHARTLASWAATCAMVGRAWANHDTPRAYTLRALRNAREQIRGARQDVPATAVADAAARVAAATRELITAVRADDRAAAGRVADRLAGEAQTLRGLAASGRS